MLQGETCPVVLAQTTMQDNDDRYHGRGSLRHGLFESPRGGAAGFGESWEVGDYDGNDWGREQLAVRLRHPWYSHIGAHGGAFPFPGTVSEESRPPIPPR